MTRRPIPELVLFLAFVAYAWLGDVSALDGEHFNKFHTIRVAGTIYLGMIAMVAIAMGSGREQ